MTQEELDRLSIVLHDAFVALDEAHAILNNADERRARNSIANAQESVEYVGTKYGLAVTT